MNFAEIVKQNLRGHDYIAARGLSRKVPMRGEQLAEPHPECAACQMQERLPDVLKLLNNWNQNARPLRLLPPIQAQRIEFRRRRSDGK